jgi:hypothetical protein
MLNATTFHHHWLNRDNHEDARFWAHWLTQPGRFSLPVDGRPARERLTEYDAPKGWPSRETTTFNLTSLFERMPTTHEQLTAVMYALRVVDALPPDPTPEQRAAAEAYLLAGEYESLYVYGEQLRAAR